MYKGRRQDKHYKEPHTTSKRAGQELEKDNPIYRLTRPKMRDYMVLIQVPLFILYPLLAIFRFASACACCVEDVYISWPAGIMALAVIYYFQAVLREYWSWMQKKAVLFGFLRTKEYWMLFRKPSEEVIGGIDGFHSHENKLNQHMFH